MNPLHDRGKAEAKRTIQALGILHPTPGDDGVPAPITPRPRPTEFLVGSCRPGSTKRVDPAKKKARLRRAKG